MERVIAHIDMDCFYCSCEVKRNPKFAGKAVIVGSTGSRGVVSAANYEARTHGVFSATPISKARRLCPDAVYLPVDMRFYKNESCRIMEVFDEISDDMIQVSVDEAYLDLTKYSVGFSDWEEMANHIQKMVCEKTGLTCSIGVSYSKTVSKIASDYKKPAGVTVVKDAFFFLDPLAVEKFPGIGKVSKKYYHENGVKTIGDLARMDRFSVLDTFGMHGVRFQKIALGLDYSRLVHRDMAKSVSRETTFSDDVKDYTILDEEFIYLSKRVHDDLNDMDDMSFKTVSIKIRYDDFTTITRDYTFRTAIKSLVDIEDQVLRLFRNNVPPGKLIRLIGVRLTNLARGIGMQMTLDRYFLSSEPGLIGVDA